MSKAAFNSAPEITLPEGRGPLVVRGDGIEVEFRDGEVIVHAGTVKRPGQTEALVTTASPAALKVGDVMQDGPNKGWIYCETKQGEAFLVAPKDSGVMQWRAAMDYAAREKSELASKAQLDAMYEARNTGALNGTFNITGSYPAGWYWSATQNVYYVAWSQNFRNGNQHYDLKSNESSVRCVRRYSVI